MLFRSSCSSNKYKTISTKEVFNKIGNINIIDVRSKEEYNSGHIESNINIPLDTIDNIKMNKDEYIVVYCQSGTRSKKASDTLISMGYNNVYDMGGINTWKYDLVEE